MVDRGPDDSRCTECGEIHGDFSCFEAKVDEMLAVAMDLGAMKAPDGILRLTDQLAELRLDVLARGERR